jgi:hypothetical protein
MFCFVYIPGGRTISFGGGGGSMEKGKKRGLIKGELKRRGGRRANMVSDQSHLSPCTSSSVKVNLTRSIYLCY